MKKLRQGDATWYNSKVVLGWDLDTRRNLLRITPNQEAKVGADLASILREAQTAFLCKWRQLLCVL